MTEQYVTKALALRHSVDIFVAQCKNGSTWFPTDGKLRIFDAWAMPRSYTQMKWIGYEIKVSRSDYLGDKKLMDYIPYCSEMYIACPWGLIGQDEVPDPIGLIYVTRGESMVTRIVKPAHCRKIDPPVPVYEYILMSRCNIRNMKRDARTREIVPMWEGAEEEQLKLFEEDA